MCVEKLSGCCSFAALGRMCCQSAFQDPSLRMALAHSLGRLGRRPPCVKQMVSKCFNGRALAGQAGAYSFDPIAWVMVSDRGSCDQCVGVDAVRCVESAIEVQ